MHETTDQVEQERRPADPVKAVRDLTGYPFASRHEVAETVSALFAALLANADDLADEAEKLGDPAHALGLVFFANRLAAARDSVRDLLRRHAPVPAPVRESAMETRWEPVESVRSGMFAWNPLAAQWDVVSGVSTLGETFTLHGRCDGVSYPILTGRCGDMVRVAK